MEDGLLRLSVAVGTALERRRAEARASAQDRAQTMQKVQQRFLASLSHGAHAS